MAEQNIAKVTFGGGEISPTVLGRLDTQQVQDGCARFRNVRALNGGAVSRRPGSRILWPSPHAAGRTFAMRTSTGQDYVLVFGPGTLEFVAVGDGTSSTLGSMVWTQSQLNAMDVLQIADSVFVAHQDWMVRQITFNGPVWLVSTLAFSGGFGLSLAQPYHKFAASDVTLTPSAVTGTGITLTASANFFVSGHIGVRFRYGGRELQITDLINPSTATADVIEDLPKTFTVGVTSSSDFRVGEVVEGLNTGAKGIVTGVPSSASLTVSLTDLFTEFDNGEEIVGPYGNSTVSGTPSVTTPAARADWAEAMGNPVRGYWGALAVHNNRLVLARHKSAPTTFSLSRAGNLYSFDAGQGDAGDAILEAIGVNGPTEIRRVYSATDLFLFTDQGVFYTAETAASPLTPTNVFLERVSDHGISETVPVVSFGNEVLFVTKGGNRLVSISPTGNFSPRYQTDDLNLVADHVLADVVSLSADTGGDGSAERYVYAVNTDGTMAVMHRLSSQQVLGWSVWTTDGNYKSVSAGDGGVFTMVNRPDAATPLLCEVFDAAQTLDAVQVDGLAGLSQWISLGSTSVLGPFTTPSDAPGWTAWEASTGYAQGQQLGIYFDIEVQPIAVVFQDQSGTTMHRRVRVRRARVQVHQSGVFAIDGAEVPAYPAGSDLSVAPPSVTGVRTMRLRGTRRDPTPVVSQPTPVALTVLSITLEAQSRG